MTEYDISNNNTSLADMQAPLTSDNVRESFHQWLISGNNVKKYSTTLCVLCLNNVSEYAREKNLCANSIWDITQYNVFKPIFNNILRSKLLRTTDRSTYKVFIVAGQLYLKYLKERFPALLHEDYCTSTELTHSKNTELIDKFTDILSARFSNGFRLNSPIEMIRFRSFAAECFDEEFTLSDEEVKATIVACGIIYEGKLYAISNETKERIRKLAEDYIANGAQAIFYTEFYAKNVNWLFEASVVSVDILIDIFRSLFPNLSFTLTYFGYYNSSVYTALESEILRVWDSDMLLSYEQIAKRLPYVPLERIKYALGQNRDFIWNSMETFSHISRIEITDQEQEVILTAALRECNARGYALITDLPLGEIEERNYELSAIAVYNAVYYICLSDKFDKQVKIVTRKGDVFDALAIMKEYCKTVDKCSLDDLLNYEKELTGEMHRRISMEAGNAILIRINKEIYVADRYVQFNPYLIDEAIDKVITDNYLPLKAFTTFGAFPDCKQTWNLFLLESYCRRFSRKFRFDAPSANSRNTGVVIRNSCVMDYTEIMTDAVANSNVPLNVTSVGLYLFEKGYIGKSTNAKAGNILDKAKTLRKMCD